MYKYHTRVGIFITLLLVAFGQTHLFSQNKINIILDTSPETTYKQYPYKSDKQVERRSAKLIKREFRNGYLAASIDSTVIQKNILIYFHRGEKYNSRSISVVNNNDTIHLSHKHIFNKKKSYSNQDINAIKNEIISNYQNSGFPNAQLISNVSIDSNKNIYHCYDLIKGNYCTFENFENKKLKKSELKYLTALTHTKNGTPYQQKKINKFIATVNQSGIYMVDSLNLFFKNNKLTIFPYVSNIKQNQLNGWFGIQNNAEHKTTLSGNISLSVKNIFKTGECINLDWNKSADESQELSLNTEFPYIYGSNIGLLGSLNIDKHDTTFLKQVYKIGLVFPLSSPITLSNYYSKRNIQIYDSTAYANQTEQNLYGIILRYKKLNKIQFPTKGFTINFDINAGNRSTNISNKALIINFETTINSYIKAPLGCIHLSNYSGSIFNDSVLLYEYFQMGGIHNMRGFNEKSIWCKSYTLFSTEYQLFLNTQSYIHLFYDIGIIGEQQHIKTSQTLQSMGAGITLLTKAGLLSVVYAIGKTNSESFKMNQAKIHIGYAYTF